MKLTKQEADAIINAIDIALIYTQPVTEIQDLLKSVVDKINDQKVMRKKNSGKWWNDISATNGG